MLTVIILRRNGYAIETYSIYANADHRVRHARDDREVVGVSLYGMDGTLLFMAGGRG